MKYKGNTQKRISQISWAILGCMLLPLSSFGVLFQVEQLSNPAGFVSNTEAIEGGTTKQSVTPTLSTNGYAFGYWKINGVRQTGDDNRSLTQVSTSISANTTFTAYYFSESEDTDSDGIMDWYEYRMFGSLSMGPTDDPDSDGFNNKRESELGQDPLIVDAVKWGGISGKLSTGFTYADTSMVLAVVKSDPAGFVTETSNYLDMNSTVTTSSLHGATNGYNFAYWSINGVRQAGPTGVSMSKVEQNVTQTTNIIAHYKPSTEDTDGDGVMDWFELYQFGNLTQGPSDDPDGDGFSNKREGELGQEATIADTVEWGGISGRLSSGFTYADNSMVLAVIKSDPAGFVTETSNYLEENSTVTTSSLHGATNGYNFAYWSVNGARQAGPTGVSLSKVATDVNATTTIVAHYKPSSEDTDGDGVMDWFELYQFGDLNQSGTDDPDGDGFSNKREGELGQEATIVDNVEWGGISGRLSPGTLYYQQQNRPPSNLELNNTLVFLNKDANQTVGSFTPTDPDDTGRVRTYTYELISGAGSQDNDKFNLLGQNLRTSQILTTEGNFSIQVRVSDDENASLDKNFTIRAIDPMGDDDNDGLGYESELAAGTNPNNPDTDGDGANDGAEVTSGTNPLDPNVFPNRPPRDLNSTSPLAFSENQPIGTVVGEFNATDLDGDAITYDFVNGDNNNSLFSLDANGTLKTATTFDYESNASTYTVTIQAKDELNATKEGNFTVTLLDDDTEDRDGDGFTDGQEAEAGSDAASNSSTPGLDYGLIAWYPFDGNASDMSGNGNHGVVNGATLGTDRHGQTNRAYKFDGDSDWILLGNSLIPVNGEDWSATMWVLNPRAIITHGILLSQYGSGSGRFEFFANENSRISIFSSIMSGSVPQSFALESQSIWNILIVVCKENNISVYENSRLTLSNLLIDNVLGADTKIGTDGHQSGRWLDGSVDDVRIYKRALLNNEVQSMYQIEKPNDPPTELNATAPLAFYENQPVGTIIGEFNATDPDANATLTYHFVNGENNNSLFILDSNGPLKTATTFDYETNVSTYTITVQAKDELNATTEGNFSISLINVIEDFDLDGIEDHYDSDDDNDGFSDAEEIAYGSDPRDANSTANAPPQITLGSTFPAQLDANGVFHIGHVENQTDIIRVAATDPDGDDLNYSIYTWQDLHHFEINASSGDLRFKQAPDFEKLEDHNKDGVYGIVLRVSDGHVHTDQPAWIWLQNENEAPYDLNASAPLQFLEEQPAGTLVGNFSAHDHDANTTLTYSILDGNGSSGNQHFILDINGTLTTAQVFDYENNESNYSIRVQVSDEQNASMEGTFVVQLINDPSDDFNSPDSNYTSPNGGYQTPPGDYQSPDGNYSSPSSDYQIPGTDYQSPNDSYEPSPENNQSIPNPTSQIYVPIVETFPPDHDGNGTYHLGGRILTDGGSSPFEVGIVLSTKISLSDPIRIATQRDQNSSVFHVSYADLLPGKTYYLRAYAVNQAGENQGSLKKFKTAQKIDPDSWYSKAEALPGGWKMSDWLGAFRPTEHQWIYHAEMGWLYPSPMEDGSLWLWNQTDGWRWTQQGVYPYLFRWKDSAWVYLQGRINGRILYYNYSTQSYE
ncbi:cadherin domain-containing protein [Opitutales bacterium]|nr:cadherin domain-containing protein [Opitutales bacterium]